MKEESNDMNPQESNNKQSVSFAERLQAAVPEQDLEQFKKQLPPDFISDAEEGFGNIRDSKQLDSVLKQLNQQMHQQLAHKKLHKTKPVFGELLWSYWAIFIVVLLAFAGF